MSPSCSTTRTELYQRVWAEPMMHLATAFGLSDVGLAKLCRKHEIPCPPRGYWAKKQAGLSPRQKPLPTPDNDYEISLPRAGEHSALLQSVQAELDGAARAESVASKPIQVAETLRNSHPLVSQAKVQLDSAEKDRDGLLIPPPGTALKIAVSKNCLRRALLILDALLKALEARGCSVSPGPMATILDVHVGFEIAELLDIVRQQPEEHDLEGRYTFGHSRFNTKKKPSGRLALRVESSWLWSGGCRHTWKDGKKTTLENRLDSVIEGLTGVAVRKKEYELQQQVEAAARREEERRRQEAAQSRAQQRQLRQQEQARVDELLQQSANWKASQDLRGLIAAALRSGSDKGISTEIDPELVRWVDWATQQADRLDPLCESPPSILDEEIPDENPHDQRFRRSW